MKEPRGEYSVNLWGSHPDRENDDCHCAADFATREEAERCYADPFAYGRAHGFRGFASSELSTAFFELDGPDVNHVKANPAYDARARRRAAALDDAAERSERAMQAGMAFGCAGYNDEMGY